MKTALLSLSNKSCAVELAQSLCELEFSLIASEGTARVIHAAGLRATEVAAFVGGKAIFGHRVVTLSREIHAALLARDTPEDQAELAALRIPKIDLVVVDLYPLANEVARAESTPESIREMTDIGGPALLRAAAKGRRIVISNMDDRKEVLDWIRNGQPNNSGFRDELASRAELVCAQYALESARAICKHQPDFAEIDGFVGISGQRLSYGENPWQGPADLLVPPSGRTQAHPDLLALSNFKRVAGAALSYNNYCDVDRLLQTITHIAAAFDANPVAVKGTMTMTVPMIAVGVKHGNACGAAISFGAIQEKPVLQRMIDGNPDAISGGWVMTNFSIQPHHAQTLIEHSGPRILDGVVAPSFSSDAIEILQRKKGRCRMLTHPDLSRLTKHSLDSHPRLRYVRGGMLRQPNYTYVLDLNDPELERWGRIGEERHADLLLAWAIGSTSTSNTITLVKHHTLIGNGVGQQSRVGAANLAIGLAREFRNDVAGAIVFSDSFFSFPDAVARLAEAGVVGILATRGSIRDQDIIDWCVHHHVPLYLLPNTKARGFYGH